MGMGMDMGMDTGTDTGTDRGTHPGTQWGKRLQADPATAQGKAGTVRAAALRMLSLRQALLLLAAVAAAAAPTHALAQGAAAAPGKVVVAGDVPDEPTRQAILARVRELYGADRVVDQLGVRQVAAPPNWAEHVQRVLQSELKTVSRGQLDIRGNTVELRGEVASEQQRQQLLTQVRTQLNNPTYTVRNGLRVSAAGQEQLDAALANRTVEFEPGSATLTSKGQGVLDDLTGVIQRMPDRRFEIIGHTDAQGARLSNLALSAARADAVKVYLGAKGISPQLLGTSGAGPDRPVASNDTAEGRARNRRIEVRAISQ